MDRQGLGLGLELGLSSGRLVVLFLSEAMRRCDAVLYWAGGDARWGADRYLGGSRVIARRISWRQQSLGRLSSPFS